MKGEHVARLVQEMHAKVAKNVRTTAERAEWTVLAGIVLEYPAELRKEPECVALGTGTQCVGLAS
jgi:hypothetical protein